MTNSDDLGARMARLRAEWPVGSMVDDVMARLGPAAPPRRRRLRTVVAASGLVAALAAAALLVLFVNRPKTLLAAVEDGIQRAGSAHLAVTVWDDAGAAHPAGDIWYARGKGLRFEGGDRIIVEDGTTQWSWSTSPQAPPTVHRRRSPGFFTTGLAARLALPDIRGDWERFRTPGLDREIDGRPCRGYTFSLTDLERLPPGSRAADGQDRRALILAEPNGRIGLITLERRAAGGEWRREREIQIAYDAPVPPENVAARLPEGARVVDLDDVFRSLYPLETALHRVELGGLILAVHDLQPLRGREGFYVVSSVRGTPEHLKQYPPRRRPLNPEITFLDVASQPMINRMWGGKYDIVGLGEANREGVEYRWWAIVPRRFFQMVDGKRVDLPDDGTSAMPDEPGRLDDVPGKARIPLAATYRDDQHRDARGVPQEVSTWALVALPDDRPPASWDDIAARARRDLTLMGTGHVGWVQGVAAGTRAAGNDLRPLTSFAPESISDAAFAAAVRRGLDDLRQCDEVRPIRPEDMMPPLGKDPAR